MIHSTLRCLAIVAVAATAMSAPARAASCTDTLVSTPQLTRFAAIVQQSGLAPQLAAGNLTVFAPTNAAFGALPAGTVDTLVKPENKPTLTKILTYHVVSGDYDKAKLDALINAGGGKAMLTTVQGEPLTFTSSHATLMVTDAKGNTANVTIPDVKQSNGDILVIDKVLMP